MRKRSFRPLLAALLGLLLVLSACGRASSLTVEDNDITGGIDVSAQNARKLSGSGSLEIMEGQCLVLSPDLTKGYFQVTVTDRDGAMVLDDVIDGRIMRQSILEPGAYDFTITGEDGATGTMAILPYSTATLQEQDQALEEALTETQEDVPEEETPEEIPAASPEE